MPRSIECPLDSLEAQIRQNAKIDPDGFKPESQDIFCKKCDALVNLTSYANWDGYLGQIRRSGCQKGDPLPKRKPVRNGVVEIEVGHINKPGAWKQLTGWIITSITTFLNPTTARPPDSPGTLNPATVRNNHVRKRYQNSDHSKTS